MVDQLSKFAYQKLPGTHVYHLYNYADARHYKVSQYEIETLKTAPSRLQKQGKTVDPLLAELKALGFIHSSAISYPKLVGFDTSNLHKTYLTKALEGFILFLSTLTLFFPLHLVTVYQQFIHFWQTASFVIVIMVVILTVISSIFLHEMTHLVFAVNRNVLVPTIGLDFRKKGGVIYTDTTGMHFLENQIDRVAIILAGPLSHLVVISLSFLFYNYFPITRSLMSVIIIVNSSFFLFNLCPIFKNDGQKLFRELLRKR